MRTHESLIQLIISLESFDNRGAEYQIAMNKAVSPTLENVNSLVEAVHYKFCPDEGVLLDEQETRIQGANAQFIKDWRKETAIFTPLHAYK